MDYFIEFAVTFLRSKLLVLMEREPSTYDELHTLVEELLNLQDEFQALVNFIDDVQNFNFSAWKNGGLYQVLPIHD